MKKFFSTAIITFIGVLIALLPAGAAGTWEKIKDSGGIKLYERAVPGTDLMEYMAVGTIDSRIEVIGEALRDVPAFNQWQTDCYGAQIEKKYDKNTFVMYMVLKPPVIEERDIVLKDKTVYDYEHGKANISFFCTNEVKIPLEKKRTRVTIMDGSFSMEYLGREKTKFIYKLKVDPAGSIPKRVAYGVMKSYPYDTIKGLRKHMAKNAKYAQAARGSDEEKKIESIVGNEPVVRKILSDRLARVARNRAAMAAVVAADKEGVGSIMKSRGNYAAVEKATTEIFVKYLEKTMGDKNKIDRLRKNKKLVEELTDLVVTQTEATTDTIESVVAKYL